MGAARCQRRGRVPAPVRGRPRQEEEGRRAEARAEELHRAHPRDGRGSRGRGDRLAPARGAEAEGPGQADGVPRDHTRGDRARPRRDPRDRRLPGRRTGDAEDPRPALRLRGVARPLEEGDATALGRTRPVGRDAPRGGARARADAVRRCHLLGHRGDVRARCVRGEARRGRRPAGGAGTRLRRGRPTQVGHPGARRGCGARARNCARRRLVRGALGRGEAVPAQPRSPVHDVDAATGSEPQAPVLVADDDARRPAAVRERIHHLHAHRLDDVVGVGADGRAQAGGEAVRRRSSSPRHRAATGAR